MRRSPQPHSGGPNHRIMFRMKQLLSVCLLLALAACAAPPATLSPTAAAPTVIASVPTLVATPLPPPSAVAEPTPTNKLFVISVPLDAPTLAPVVATTTTLTTTLTYPPNFMAEFDGAQALAHAQTLAPFVPRNPGTPGWQQTGDYIIAQMRAAGWEVEEQRFTYNNVACRNIIAKRGTGPLLLVGAHYDGRTFSDQDPDPARRNDPMPGANDGLSGVAALLELGRVVQPEAFGRTVWLTFFDAEDNGGINGWDWIAGSRHVAQTLTITPTAMVLLDMMGDADLSLYYESNSDPYVRQTIWAAAQHLGFPQFIAQEKHSMLDDHTPFLERGIPAVDIIDFDYPYWHTTADTVDKLSAESLNAVGDTMELWLESGGVTAQ